jgi:VWFA-related protein
MPNRHDSPQGRMPNGFKWTVYVLVMVILIFLGCSSGGSSGSHNGSADTSQNSTTPSSNNGGDDPPDEAKDVVNVKITQVDRSFCPTLKAYVSVTDENDEPIPELTSGNFLLYEDAIQQPDVQIFWTPNVYDPISVALVLDYSNSMGDEAQADMEMAAKTFIEQLGEDDWAEVIKFSYVGEVVQAYTPNKTALTQAIETEWQFDGLATLLYDSIQRAINDTAARPGRRAVLVITDGTDNASSSTLENVIANATDSNTPVFTIGLNQAETDLLRQLADESSGQYFYAPTSDDLNTIYNTLAQVFKNQYVISYESALADENPYLMEIQVDSQTYTATDSREFQACGGIPDLQAKGSVDTPGTALDLQVHDSYTYVADGTGGLQIIDFSQPDAPSIVGSLDSLESEALEAVDIDMAYPYVFLAAKQNGLAIVDVSDPASPQLVNWATPNELPQIDKVTSVAVYPPFVYLLDDTAGMAILKFNGGEFDAIGVADVHGRGLVITGRYAYIAAEDGLAIYDIRDFNNPEKVGEALIPGGAQDITITYPYAFLPKGAQGGLAVVDVSLPQSPQVLDNLSLSGQAMGAAIYNSFVFLASADAGIHIIDARRPATLLPHDQLSTTGSALGIVSTEDTVLVADGTAGLQIFELN